MKKFFGFLFIAVLLCFSAYGIYSWNESQRFCIESPMQDLEYKTQIIKSSHNPLYRLEKLRPLVGESELAEFIKTNDDNPKIYAADDNFRASLHMHTTNSDGRLTVEEMLNQAEALAKKICKDDEYLYIAITDHNTVNGAKELIRILQKNKYSKIKVIAGMELYTAYNNSKFSKEPVQIHVLALCINPYDEFLNKEFYKKNKYERYNHRYPVERDFDELIGYMKNYAIVGIAHPILYTLDIEDKYSYMEEMFNRYKKAYGTEKPAFTEAYYQSYRDKTKLRLGDEYEKYLNYITDTSHKMGIIRTGSMDTHGTNIRGR